MHQLLEKLSLKEFPLKRGLRDEPDEAETASVALYESIKIARQAWEDAKIMYDHATEKTNIDALIHKMNACEREYIYLLKLARHENIRVYPGIK